MSRTPANWIMRGGVNLWPPNQIERNKFVTSDDAEILYRVKGSGPPIVLIHGWSQSGAMFGHQVEHLSRRYQVIVPDVRGHGGSPPPRGGLRMSRLAKDLEELLTHLNITRAHLLGWSMGASIVWSYVDLFGTGGLDKLILVDQPSMLTVWPESSPAEIAETGALFTLAQLDELRKGLRSVAGEELRASFVRGMVTPDIADDLYRWILEENAKTPLGLAAELLWSHCSQDWRDVLARIDRPTLIVCGAKSHVNKESQYYIQRSIKNARLREFSEFENGSHFMFLEAPRVFNAVLQEFLEG